MDLYGVPIAEILFSDRVEKDVEAEETLPEYCPNILRIVRADAYPVITDKSYDGRTFNVQGRVSTRVIYVSDYHDKLKSVTFSEEFTHSFSCKETDGFEEAQTDAEGSVVSLSAKMTSQRSVLLRKRISLAASAVRQTENNLFSPSPDDAMCVLEEKIELCTRKKLPVTEKRCEADINIENTLPAASEIVYADAFCSLDKSVCLDGRMEYHGTAHFHCMYESENGTNETSETGYVTLCKDIPFDGEVEGADFHEGQTALVTLESGLCDAGISYDPYGENRIITAGIAYTVKSEIQDCSENRVCTDAFCTKYDSSVKMTTVTFEKNTGSINENARVEETLHADLHNFTEISDSFATLHVTGTELADGKVFVNARAGVTVFGKGENGAFNCADIPVTLHIPTSQTATEGESHYEICADVKKVGVYIRNGEALCEMEVGLCGSKIEKRKVDAVESVAVDLDREHTDSREELIICYPGENEKIWNIAKNYGVDPEVIKKSNSLESDTTGHKKMLIIP